MKAISFSAIEILPALLDKTKTQTIRPLFDPKTGLPRSIGVIGKGEPLGKREVNIIGNNEKPRFKVGEKVRLYWKQRSKFAWFDKTTGKGILKLEDTRLGTELNPYSNLFYKILGEGIIKEVFEIKLEKTATYDGGRVTYLFPKLILGEHPELFAQKDGFKNFNLMIEWFHNHYDLSIPKIFAVYRWEWI